MWVSAQCKVICERHFSNLLIIHQVKTKEIHNRAVTEVWILVLINIDVKILFLRLLLSFYFDCEDISNTKDAT